MTTYEILKNAKELSYSAPLSTEIKNNALKLMAEYLVSDTDVILKANAIDFFIVKSPLDT